jgi:hypothetical protein
VRTYYITCHLLTIVDWHGVSHCCYHFRTKMDGGRVQAFSLHWMLSISVTSLNAEKQVCQCGVVGSYIKFPKSK